MEFIEEKLNTVVNSDFETVVCGGGIAGVSAALSSARNGAKTLLIEREFLLGGLATLGLIAIYLPICDGNGRQVSFGIAEELLRLSVKHGCESKNNAESWLNGEKEKTGRFTADYNPFVFASDIEQMLVKNGVQILYGTTVCGAVRNDDKISHIITENKSGRTAFSCKNVIDATGDADVCSFSGCSTEINPDGNLLAGWHIATKNGEQKLHMLGACDSQAVNDEFRKSVSLKRISGIDAKELSDFAINSHRIALNKFLEDGNVTAAHSLSSVAFIPQVRMTRRLDGVYTEKFSDVHKFFKDSVGLFSDWERKGPVYELPFSALLSKNISNLLCAGRCVSAENGKMWNVMRVIPVCAVTGEAAGTAAALFDNFENIDIIKLQDTLRKSGVKLHESELGE